MWNYFINLFQVDTVLVFVVVFLGIWLYLSTRFPDGFPPGPRPLPVLGNLGILANNQTQSHLVLKNLSKKYGPVVGLKMGSYPTIIINDFAALKECLVNKADVFSTRPTFMHVVNEGVRRPVYVGKPRGVIWQNGQVWKDGRRFLLSSMRDFGVGKRSIEGKIQEETHAVCNELMKKAGKPHDMHLLLQQSVSNIICNVIFGSRFEYSDEEFKNLLKRWNSIFRDNVFTSLINFIPILKVLPKPKWFHQFLSNHENNDKWLQNTIIKHRESFDPNDIRDLTDLYHSRKTEDDNTSDAFSHYNFNKNLEDLILAGSETSETALRGLLVLMLNYPEVQSKCQKEIDEVIGSRMVTLADKENMPFIEAVIHECLRFRPPVALGVPHAADKDTSLYSYKIPKGTLVLTNLYSVHMDTKYWDNPEEFCPERWIDPDGKFQKNEAFAVFSLGPRVCLGEILAWAELFIFFTSMLQKFTFQPAQTKKPPSMEGNLGVTLSPKPFVLVANPR